MAHLPEGIINNPEEVRVFANGLHQLGSNLNTCMHQMKSDINKLGESAKDEVFNDTKVIIEQYMTKLIKLSEEMMEFKAYSAKIEEVSLRWQKKRLRIDET